MDAQDTGHGAHRDREDRPTMMKIFDVSPIPNQMIAGDTQAIGVSRMFKKISRSPHFSVSTSSLLAVCHFVAGGLGCGIVDPFTAYGARQLPIEFRPLEPRMVLHYGLLWEKRKPLPARLERFAEILATVATEIGSGAFLSHNG